jgi:peptidyl-dipeptidase Dcp
VYHPGVRAFEVRNARSRKLQGVLFLDLHERKYKPAGLAWSVPILSKGSFFGSAVNGINIIVMKLPGKRKNSPLLLTHEDVQTLFHEFGHAMHDFLSDVKYRSHAGTNVESDFVEFPSQISELWTYEPEVLKSFACHIKTGEQIPDHLISKIKKARSFMAASRMLSYARKSWLDLAWAEANNGCIKDVRSFEKRALSSFCWNPKHGEVISTSFSHIFGGGYEISFYGYQWAEALAADAFNLFEQKGLYDRSMAGRLRNLIRQGASKDSSALYREFRYRCARMNNFFNRFGLFINSPVTMDMLYSPRRTAGAAPAAFHRRHRNKGRYLGY